MPSGRNNPHQSIPIQETITIFKYFLLFAVEAELLFGIYCIKVLIISGRYDQHAMTNVLDNN